MTDSALLALAQKEAARWADRKDERERLIQALSARGHGVGPAGLVTVG
jgi:hypothetical protein